MKKIFTIIHGNSREKIMQIFSRISKWSHDWEEAVEEAVDALGDLTEVLGVVAELAVVAVDNHQLARIGLNPLLVAPLEALEVVEAH